MKELGTFLVLIVALFHIGFLILEMFLWRRRIGKQIFHLSEEAAELTAPLAMNMGFYNGILAAALLFSLFIQDPHYERVVQLYLLTAIAFAGIFGSLTASRRIFFYQTVPALVALVYI